MSNKPIRKRTQAERTEASDKAMFKAAIQLIAKHGPSDKTLAKVGKKAGFSGGLVSYRFGSKSGLLMATTERILELWRTRVLSSFDSEGTQWLMDVADAYLDAAKKRSDLMLALFRLMQDSYCSCPEILQHFQEFDVTVRSVIIDKIKAGKKSKQIQKNVDAEAFALAYVGVLRGITLQYFINPKAVDLKTANSIVRDMCKKLLNK